MREAASKAREALTLLSRASEPKIYLWAQHNLALYLAEQGKYEEAADLLAANRDLYQAQSAPVNTLHFAWLSGRISAGLGLDTDAESSLLVALEGFIAHRMAYDAALVSLDLALLYLQQRRVAEVKALAVETVAVFEAEGIHREAVAAWVLFRQAADRESLDSMLVKRLARFFEEAKTDPNLVFDPGRNG